MKISAKQASLLAKEVFEKLKKLNVGQVSDHMVNRLKSFHDKRAELKAICKKADEALQLHDKTLRVITGNNKLDAYDSLQTNIAELKEAIMPKLSEIEDKIILTSMFATDDDLETFITKITKQFTKAKPKIPSNAN